MALSPAEEACCQKLPSQSLTAGVYYEERERAATGNSTSKNKFFSLFFFFELSAKTFLLNYTLRF